MLNADLLQVDIWSQYTKEELQEKEALLRVSLLAEPDSLSLLEDLASLSFYKRDYDAALHFFQKVSKLDPENAAHWNGFIGFVYYEQEDYAEAIHYLEKMVDQDPEAPFVYFLLGNAYSCLGKIKHATWCYELAIFQDFDIYTAHVDFGRKYEKIGNKDKALVEYCLAYEIDPRDPELREKIEELGK